jgi:phosphatidylserine/phosphatidylglycerophosphate/cardiolipin synthase-like enzyme
MNKRPDLVQQIARLVADMPEELVAGLATVLQQHGNANLSQLQTKAIEIIVQPDLRRRVLAFLHDWQRHCPDVSAASVALALLAAAETAAHYRHFQQLELVWTGPDSQVIPLRRTDQALLQLIREARQTLHIVSFAVYKADNIAQALVEATRRGVAIAIYLETASASEGKMSFDTVRALGEAVTRRARLYVWPKEKRPLTEDGRFGSLHAKVALADGRTMLISSANLTGYAMTLNMEMGLLVRGGAAPSQVEQHLLRLVEQGVFQRV